MIKTYTPGDLSTLALPGDLPGLLDGYCGRVEWRVSPDTDCWEDAVYDGPFPPDRHRIYQRGHDIRQRADRLRLPLSRWEARARVVAWAAEGERCPHQSPTDIPLGRTGCPRCKDSAGYLRAPADCRRFLDWPGLPGSLPAWQSAAILHASALRVAAGMGVIVGVLDAWLAPDGGPEKYVRPVVYSPASSAPIHLLFSGDRGWRANIPVETGTETGEAGKVAADVAALAAGYALLDGDSLRIEVSS